MSIKRLMFFAGVPKPIQNAFDVVNENDLEPEVKLWREVAARVTLDALGCTGYNEIQPHRKAILEAREWFKYCQEDVETVFDLANIEPEIVISYVLKGYVK